MSNWPLITYSVDLSVIFERFPNWFLKFLFFFPFLWYLFLNLQLLVLLSNCFFFRLLHLLSAMLIVIVYFLPDFWLYWFDLEYIIFCFFLVCVRYQWAHLSFCALVFVRFLLLSQDNWLVVRFYGISTLFGLFNAELNFKQFSLV